MDDFDDFELDFNPKPIHIEGTFQEEMLGSATYGVSL